MLDFSSYEDKKSVIFNNGVAGAVKNTRLEVRNNPNKTKDTQPDYYLYHIDAEGRELRGQGIWELTGNEEPEAKSKTIQALGKIWRMTVGGVDFPKVNTLKEFWESVIASTESFEVFVTYGTTEKASSWLGTRRYDFIQNSHNATGLQQKPNDNMVRVMPDKETAAVSTSTTTDDLPF
jgi:hypothetical protein